MQIIIPSRGRATWGQQVTVRQLLDAKIRCALMVPKGEFKAYAEMLEEHVGHSGAVELNNDGGAKTIGDVRKYIQHCYPEQVLMFDDDMYFYQRPNMLLPALVKCKGKNLRKMINRVHGLLQLYPMVGISARQGNNTVTGFTVKKNTRAMNAYAFDFQRLKRADIKFGRMPIMEDFDITLQMLRKGISNCVLYEFCWNQAGSGKKGGCSEYRDADMQAAAARMLKKFHPDYVTLVEKESKSGWKDMETRTDVRIAWQKAAQAGGCR